MGLLTLPDLFRRKYGAFMEVRQQREEQRVFGWGAGGCGYQPKLNRTRCNRARGERGLRFDNGELFGGEYGGKSGKERDDGVIGPSPTMRFSGEH